MLATQADTFINALLNTSIHLSVNINVFLEAHRDKNLLNEDQFFQVVPRKIRLPHL